MKIEKLLVQQYNTDLPERNYDDKEEMSWEDKQFLQSVEKMTIFENGHYCVGLPLFKLDPILQNGILRVGGRLNKAAMPENAKQH